ncbi:hypothetical protein [Nocardia farcinica]|uniref:hypothetical protein n=1 Tax=Nocardia farcinica TaxID=37329 RepID=UPI0024585C1B|nr:hypothetical protein [Nocardia farcinica]
MPYREGDKVLIGTGGTQVFAVIEVDYLGDAERVLIQSVDDAPGVYPFPARVSELRAVDQQ